MLAIRAAQRALTACLVRNAIVLALPLQIVLFLLAQIRAILNVANATTASLLLHRKISAIKLAALVNGMMKVAADARIATRSRIVKPAI
jgi:hypothetical protein